MKTLTAEQWVNIYFKKQITGSESYPDVYASKEGIVQSHIIFANEVKKELYTEDDVKKAIELATTSKYDHKLEFYSEEEIIEQLKQSKK